MFLSDTHTHSRFSFDGSDTAAAMEKAPRTMAFRLWP